MKNKFFTQLVCVCALLATNIGYAQRQRRNEEKIMKPNYKHTLYACFVRSIVQAIVNNFVPLLSLTFLKSYGIPLSQITLLVTINFALQLIVDLASISFVDRIGYRASAILAHVCAAIGLVCLTILPEVTPEPFWGIMVSVIIYAVGGGL